MVAKTISVPNIRKILRPDPGHIWFDIDLAAADAQVVAWDSDCKRLKEFFREANAWKPHHVATVAGKDIWFDVGGKPKPDLHNKNKDDINHLLKPLGIPPIIRKQAKQGVHLTNYAGIPYVLARTLKIPKRAAELFQSAYFELYPEILLWHERINEQLQTYRYVENKFGYRRFYFDRPDNLLKEGLAWIPQSTVAEVIERGDQNLWDDMELRATGTEALLQVHDSLGGQYPVTQHPHVLSSVKENLLVTIPYDDPLTIPIDVQVSPKSWGNAVKINVEEAVAQGRGVSSHAS